VFFRGFPRLLRSHFNQDDQGRYVVRFTYRPGCPNEEKIDRHFLALHLAVAHVMNATGAGGLIEWEDDEEGQQVMFEEVRGPYRFNPRFAEQLHSRLVYV
jgi:hypothetical protein